MAVHRPPEQQDRDQQQDDNNAHTQCRDKAARPTLRLLSVGVDASAPGDDGPLWAKLFGFIALILASVNIFGGFLVTERMLSMYKKKG